MTSKLISIYLDGQQLTVKKLNLNDSLDKVCKVLSEKINDSYLFQLENGDKIQLSDEPEITVEDIL